MAGDDASTDPAEHHLRVHRSARYYTLGDAATADEIWFVLHGYRQLAGRFIRKFGRLAAGGSVAVVAAEGLSRFYLQTSTGRSHDEESRVGAAWMTREDREHEIEDYVEYLDRLARHVHAARDHPGEQAGADASAPTGLAPPRVILLGFSQGSETASRWAVHGDVHFDELVFWGGGPAEDLDLDQAAERLSGRRTTFVYGDQDGWGRDKAERWSPRLEALGASVATLRFEGGHRIDPAALERLRSGG